jgi:hypothetical protein
LPLLVLLRERSSATKAATGSKAAALQRSRTIAHQHTAYGQPAIAACNLAAALSFNDLATKV